MLGLAAGTPLKRERGLMRLAGKSFHAMFLLGSVVGVAVGCGRAVASEVIEIFEHNGEYSLDAPPADRPPLALLIPEEFRYGGSKGKTTAWGVNLLTYYPRMTSQLAPENADFGLACRGDCNGRILISVENVAHGRGAITGMADVIAHSLIPRFLHIGGAEPKTLPPQHGFDGGYQVDIPGGSGVSPRSNIYLQHLGPDQAHYDLFAECNVNKFARTCNLHFSSQCSASIYINVGAIDMIHIDKFFDVKSKVDRFISSMVQRPACASNN